MNQEIAFVKMTGSGNDFIIIDNRAAVLVGRDIEGFVSRVCKRRVSIGSDGLILVEPSDRVDFRWRFFNADGSEAEMCGNGARCVARFAFERGIAPRRMTFETLAGDITAEMIDRSRVKVRMVDPGKPPEEISVRLEDGLHRLMFINTGVPHAVEFVEELEGVDVEAVGSMIRHHSRFQPEGTNVDFVKITNRSALEMRTYERGVEGETLACGTGAVASAICAAQTGMVQSPVEVKTRGGEILRIYFEAAGAGYDDVHLEGDTRVVCKGFIMPEAYLR